MAWKVTMTFLRRGTRPFSIIQNLQFYSFDEGEYSHANSRQEDHVEAYTRADPADCLRLRTIVGARNGDHGNFP
jgi:hypothetical protein